MGTRLGFKLILAYIWPIFGLYWAKMAQNGPKPGIPGNTPFSPFLGDFGHFGVTPQIHGFGPEIHGFGPVSMYRDLGLF